MGLVATLREGLRVAFDSLRANKVRSGLTILGVAIGVLVVMAMAAVVQGINDSFSEALSSRGTTTFYVFHAPIGGGGGISTGLEEEENEFFKNPPLEPAWTEELSRLPGIDKASALADLGQAGFHGSTAGEDVRISLYAVDASFLEIDGGDVIDGRWFTEIEDARRAAVAVIDSQVAQDLFAGADPIGKFITIGRPGSRSARFEVIGTYRRPPNVFSSLASHWVFIPFSASMKYLDLWRRMIAFTVRAEDGVPLDVALDVVRGKMRQLRGLQPSEEDNFNLITQDEFIELWGKLTGVLFAVMVALSGVGLMVGGVGVIGIMMISVTERTREIGLRKAVGARRRDLLLQFLVEAATLTALGGAIGMALGGVVVWLVTNFTPIPASVPTWAIGVALFASILTGVGFGLYPAARGATLDPVEALRYE